MQFVIECVIFASLLQLFHLHKNKIIRQITALGLLLLFILSNTPRQLIHDLFANHKDYKNGITASTHPTDVYQSSFHCQTDNFVAESPFTHDSQAFTFSRPFSYIQLTTTTYSFAIVRFQRNFDLRGPPML